MKPLITIIIPTFNYGAFIKETIQSVLDQSLIDWECIIVDDGSFDNTKLVVQSFIERDERIRYIYQNNQGLSSARNTGLKAAGGKYIQLLDSDDLIHNQKLLIQSTFLAENEDTDIVFGPSDFFEDINGNRICYEWPQKGKREVYSIQGQPFHIEDILIRNRIPVNSPLFRMSVIEDIGYFDQDLKSVEDWDFWMRALMAGKKFKFINNDQTKALIRQHSNTMRANLPKMAFYRIVVRKKINSILNERLGLINHFYLNDALKTLLYNIDPKNTQEFEYYVNATFALTKYKHIKLLKGLALYCQFLPYSKIVLFLFENPFNILKGIFNLLFSKTSQILKRILKYFYWNLRKIFKSLFPYKIASHSKISEYFIKINSLSGYPINIKIGNEELRERFDYLKKYTEEEYLFCYTKTAIIEPEWGWLISERNEIILPSIPGNNYNKPKNWVKHPLPNKFDRIFKKREIIELNEAIYLNYFFNFANNYWHFFNNFLGQLYFMENEGVDLSLPVIIHKQLWESNTFKQAFQLSTKLQSINWLAVENNIIRLNKTWCCKNFPYKKEHLIHVEKYLDLVTTTSLFDNPNYEKVFLVRKNVNNRILSNENEIWAILEKYGFIKVDSATMTLKEQIQLFKKVTHCVAIHGAGVTNTIFSGTNNFKLFEIFPADWIVGTYFIVANELGFKYNGIIGTTQENGCFTVDINKFTKQFEILLNM